MSHAPPRPRIVAVVGALYLAIAAAYAWPILARFGTHIVSDPGDPLLNLTIVWRNATMVPLTTAWWNAPHYYPSEGITAFTENLLGVSPLTTPLIWLTDSPLAAYNLALFLTWPLSALAAYLLVRFLTKRDDAAVLAGLAYAFAPYRAFGFAHIQILSSYWMPIYLLGLHGYLEHRRTRWLWLFGAAWMLQALTNGYFLLFGLVLVALWIAYFGTRRRDWRSVGPIVAAWGLSTLALVPILLEYRAIHQHFGLSRGESEAIWFSATPHSFVEVTTYVWLWRSVLSDVKENLFPGVVAIGLVLTAVSVLLIRRTSSDVGEPKVRRRPLVASLSVIIALSIVAIVVSLVVGPWRITVLGIVIRMTDLNRALALCAICGVPLILLTPRLRTAVARRSPLLFYAAMTPIMALLACGPLLRVGDSVILDPAPYKWLLALPGFDGLRVPARFWMLGVLCLSIAAGLAFNRLRPLRARAARPLFVAVAAGLLLDGWVTGLPMAAVPELRPVVEPSDRAEAILELPLGPAWDFAATYRAGLLGRRMVNGVSGYNPPHYTALVAGLESREPAMLTALASLGPLDIVVDGASDPDGAWARYAAGAPGAVRIGDDGTRSLYRVPPAPPEPAPGTVLAITFARVLGGAVPEVHDGNITSGWGEIPQRPGQLVLLDLGTIQDVGGVTQAIGEYFLDFPRRLAIELSPDGETWSRVWEGSGAPPAFLAGARAPRITDMRFVFSPRRARYVRLIQLESARTMWRVSEITVHGPAGPSMSSATPR